MAKGFGLNNNRVYPLKQKVDINISNARQILSTCTTERCSRVCSSQQLLFASSVVQISITSQSAMHKTNTQRLNWYMSPLFEKVHATRGKRCHSTAPWFSNTWSTLGSSLKGVRLTAIAVDPISVSTTWSLSLELVV